MPEGHTLRRLADDLTGAFAGSRTRVSSPQGRFAADAAALDGAPLVVADSAGKHLFIEFEGDRFVHIHLGLIGSFQISDGIPDPVGAIRLRISRADGKFTADLRGATRCDLIGPERRDQVVADLGPDPLRCPPEAADPQHAWRRISKSPRTIGDLLMDQSVVAGVGNVYRAEVLFRQRMHPLRPGNTLRRGQWQAIWDDLVELMAEGVATGRIDTVRPEHTPEAMGRPPRKDDHGGEVYVYRRATMPCLVCRSQIKTELLAGRNSFWCPRCQPRFRSRARRPA